MFERNKEEKKNRLIALFIFNYMIDYCNSENFLQYVASIHDDNCVASLDEIYDAFINLSKSIHSEENSNEI